MSRTLFAAVAATAILAAPARAAAPGAAQVLTPDAHGFLHVRVGDVWNADVAKQLRAFAQQAGPDLLAEFDTRFYPAPSDVESFTVVLFEPNFRDVLPSGRPTDKSPVWVVTSKKPLDKAALLTTLMKGGKTRKHGGKEYFFDESNWSGVFMLDAQSYAFASEDSITDLIDRLAKNPPPSPLAALFARVADKHPATLGVNIEKLATPEVAKGIPPEFAPLLKAKTLVVAADAKPKTTVSAALEFTAEADAKDGVKAVQEAVQFGRGQIGNALLFVEGKARGEPGQPAKGIQAFPETVGLVLAVAGLKQVDALLGAMPVAAKGTTVSASLELDSVLPGGSTAVSIATVAAAIGVAVSGNEPRGTRPGEYDWTERERNMAALAKAIDRYKADKGHYPPPAIADKDGKPLLSWRVAILPYMEDYTYINNNGGPGEKPIRNAKELYALFKLDEPWDGPNNKKLIDKLPSPYRAPWGAIPYSQSNVGKTMVMAVVGKGAIFDPTKKGGVTGSDVHDGLKQTLLLLQLEEPAHAVYWSKPADVELTAAGKLPADGPNLARRLAVVYADGSAHTFVNGVDLPALLGTVTRDGGEKLDEKVIRPEPIKQGSVPK
jgi:hypothetical protein